MGAPTPLSQAEVDALAAEFPNLPQDYLRYLAGTGWGEAASGSMIYSGPIYPDAVFGPGIDLEHVVLLGDDFQGNCLGYNLATKQYGEVIDNGTWESWPTEEGIAEYVTEP